MPIGTLQVGLDPRTFWLGNALAVTYLIVQYRGRILDLTLNPCILFLCFIKQHTEPLLPIMFVDLLEVLWVKVPKQVS